MRCWRFGWILVTLQGVAERPIALSTGLVCIYVVDKKRWCKLVQQAYQLANLHNIITAFQMLGNPGSLAYEPWPQYDETRLVEDSIKLPVQVRLHLLHVLPPTSLFVAFAAARNHLLCAAGQWQDARHSASAC